MVKRCVLSNKLADGARVIGHEVKDGGDEINEKSRFDTQYLVPKRPQVVELRRDVGGVLYRVYQTRDFFSPISCHHSHHFHQ